MKNIIILMIAILGYGMAFAQTDTSEYPKVMIDGSDTLFVATIGQAKEMAIRNVERNECLEKEETYIAEIVNNEEHIDTLNNQVDDYKKLLLSNSIKIEAYKEKEKSYIKEKGRLNKKIKRVKTGRTILGIIAIATTVLGILL